MDNSHLNLQMIAASLRDVQANFSRINDVLRSRRDSMTDEVVERMLAGYSFVNDALKNRVDLLHRQHRNRLLELNHIVLCGLDPGVRKEHHKHIEAAARRFYNNDEGYDIDRILGWYEEHSHESPWKRAAGVYVRVLSQPQLYIEGNHRTGALIMSYILARDGKAPFVLTVPNAKAYFDPSTLIKETKKTTFTFFAKLPRLKKQFAHFLHDQANGRYLMNDSR